MSNFFCTTALVVAMLCHRSTKNLPARRLVGRPAVLALALALAGCASVPDVTVQYRPVAFAVAATVVHTITCTRDKTQAIVSRDGAFTPVYRANTTDEPFELRLKNLDRFFADSDLTVGLTEDGRLKTINQSTTGQGEAITKSVVSAAATIGTVLAAASVAPLELAGASADKKSTGILLLSNNQLRSVKNESVGKICNVVEQWVGATSQELPQIAVVQTGTFKAAETKTLNPGSEQASVVIKELKNAGLDLTVSVTTRFADDNKAGLQPISTANFVRDDEVPLKLQQTRSFVLKAKQYFAHMSPLGEDPNGPNSPPKEDLIKQSTVTVPGSSTDNLLVLPIPKPALFGTQKFQLTLAESGRIVSMGYGRTVGAAGALNAATSLASAETVEEAAEAAALKASADLIAQQARLRGCLLKPEECK